MKRLIRLKTILITAMLILAGVGIAVWYHSNRHKRDLEKQVLALTGMKIDLTFDNATEIFDGRDSIYTSAPKKKLVIFVDSTSCSGCFISHLTDYFEINDTLKSRNAELLVVLHPRQSMIEEATSRLSQERYPFRCIVDYEGEFIRNNPGLPDNQLLHSFSLDENNNIFLVGNPTRNQRIKELLYKTLLQQPGRE